MTHTFNVSIPENFDSGAPAFQGVLKRINVILGANGSGKSKLLEHLSAHAQTVFGEEFHPVRVEGGRIIKLDINLEFKKNKSQFVSNLSDEKNTYRKRRRSTVDGRIANTLVLLRALEFEQKVRHSDEVEALRLAGRLDDIVAREVPPLEQLFNLFQSVFPELKLYLTENSQVYVERSGSNSYPASNLSDGERQVLFMLADIAIITTAIIEERSVFIIDEPELNLHPSLADRLWTSLESQYPNDVFVYATHSLSFALRSNVDSIFVLGHGKIGTEDLIESDHTELSPFLGALPGITRLGKCLVVEGKNASFDRPFYTWLLNSNEFDVVPIQGGSNDVISAIKREGFWFQISSQIKLVGLVDRDFSSDTITSHPNIITLQLHEAESYLCHPDIVMALNDKLKLSGRTLSTDNVIDCLIESAKERLTYVVARRVLKKISMRIHLPIRNNRLKNIQSVDDFTKLVLSASKHTAKQSENFLNEASLTKQIKDEEENCQSAIDNRDVEKLLILFEGKLALQRILALLGCKTEVGVLNASIEHLNIDQYPHLKKLREGLLSICDLPNPHTDMEAKSK